MKEKKQLVVMTFFGPIPFGVVKEHLSKKSVESTDSAKDKTLGNVEGPVPVPMHVDYYIVNLAKKVGWKPVKMVGYLQSLWNINPCAAFSVLLREVAIELDKRYEDHINNCEEVFIISSMMVESTRYIKLISRTSGTLQLSELRKTQRLLAESLGRT